ncbi:MAG TPA: RING finger protein [Planctomycetota bacterium]|jgi:RING finger family protein|nr:RING finger protein [Planctomycetota bacterium]
MEAFAVILLILVLINAMRWSRPSWSDSRAALRDRDLLAAAPSSPFRFAKRRIGGADLEDLRRAYGAFAAERDGRRLDRSPYEGPRVCYLHRAARAVLSVHGESIGWNEEYFTRLAYAVPPEWRHRIEIAPALPGELEVSQIHGLVRITTGDAAFDRHLRVEADDPRAAQTILDPGTRRALEDLRELLANGHIHLSTSSGRIVLQKRGILAEQPELSLYAALCDSIYDRICLVWQRENGIEILEDASPAPAVDPKCQVCSHAIPMGNRVQCRRCRTAHHADCWEFNGGCATFACGEKVPVKKVA